MFTADQERHIPDLKLYEAAQHEQTARVLLNPDVIEYKSVYCSNSSQSTEVTETNNSLNSHVLLKFSASEQ